MDLDQIRKKISSATSFYNFATNEHCGDKEMMTKLAAIEAGQLNKAVLGLLRIDSTVIGRAREEARQWIEFLNGAEKMLD